jgi:hypothetical protein
METRERFADERDGAGEFAESELSVEAQDVSWRLLAHERRIYREGDY